MVLEGQTLSSFLNPDQALMYNSQGQEYGALLFISQKIQAIPMGMRLVQEKGKSK